MRFLDATITKPADWRHAARMLRLPLLLAALVGAAALWLGKAPAGAVLFGIGALVGAGLSAFGINLTRSPLAYFAVLGLTAAALFSVVLLLAH